MASEPTHNRSKNADGGPRSDHDSFFSKALITAGVASVFVIALALFVIGIDIFLLAFGGILLAVFLGALSRGLSSITPLQGGWSLLAVLLILSGLVIIGGVTIAPQISRQFDEFTEQIPELVEQVESILMQYGWGERLLESMDDEDNSEFLLDWSSNILAGLGQTLFYLLTILFIGLFLAVNPRLYIDGFVILFPAEKRKRTFEIIIVLARTLRWWLVGRAIAMTMIGVSTAILLAVLGIPFAILLGVLVGLLTFIPYLGPILGTIPIAFVALMEGPMDMLYAVGLYAVLQHIEGYVIDPIIQQHVVHLPPVITIFSQVLLGIVLGPLGIAFATPLAAILMVFTRIVYIQDTLGDNLERLPVEKDISGDEKEHADDLADRNTT